MALRVSLGRHPSFLGEFPDWGKTFFGSSALWIPDHEILGVADSWHHYHLYPISERDVQAAFNVVRDALAKHAPSTSVGTDFLQDLLRTVHRSLAEIDVRAHIAGIDFEKIGLSGRVEPANDPEAKPVVHIILTQLRGCDLSISSVGNFLVYSVNSMKQELIFGADWISGIQVAVKRADWAWLLAARSNTLEICSCEVKVSPDDLIVVATPSLGETIALAKLHQFVNTEGHDPEAVSEHLMATLRSALSEEEMDSKGTGVATKHSVGRFGAAWAITYVEK